MKPRATSGGSGLLVHRLSKGAQLVVAEADTVLVVVRGACSFRGLGHGLERAEAGAVLVADARTSLDRRVVLALSLLQAAPAQRWTVARLARKVGLSRAAFARRFALVSGRSPLRYLTDLRLALAANCLEHGDDSLAEVAQHVGYRSEFSFSRAFKRKYGVAPGTFRRLRLASAGSLRPMLAAA